MKKKVSTKQITMAGLLTALGMLLPYVTSHAVGVPGNILLPMHLPVLLMGLLCGPTFGFFGGLLIPTLSSILTGMPVLFPMLPMMAVELATYGLVSGLLRGKARLPIYPSLLLAMLAGRVSYGLMYAALLTASGGALRAASVTAAVSTGLPGIVIQLVVIPPIVKLLERALGLHKPRKETKEWLSYLTENKVSLAVLQKDQVVYETFGRGIRPMMQLLEDHADLLKDATVVDKIIGKAAAMLLVKGGVRFAYGQVMSIAARDYLQAHGVETAYGLCIDVISNREGTGICPMERTVMELSDPEEGYLALKETMRKLAGA